MSSDLLAAVLLSSYGGETVIFVPDEIERDIITSPIG
jgi:hypothetical protein